MRPVRPGERGAALLTVLLLVAVMGALTAAAFERLRLSSALAIGSAGLDQTRAFAIGLESLATLGIDDLVALDPERTTLAGGWNGQTRRYPLPDGMGVAEARLRDGGNCFNLNSVVEGAPGTPLTPRMAGITQFEALMILLDVPPADARPIAAAAADWVDSDLNALPDGAEDDHYARAEQPYRTANALFADVTELRAVAGMTSEIYERMRPWLCALPVTDLSPVNVNTLAPDQAPLLAMLAPSQIEVAAARQALARRPASGWSELSDFYRSGGFQGVILPLDVQTQAQLRTRWFKLDLLVELQGAELSETALIDARVAPARVVARTWGDED